MSEYEFENKTYISYKEGLECFYKIYNTDLYDMNVLIYLQNKINEGIEPKKIEIETYFGNPTCFCEYYYNKDILKIVKIDFLSKYGRLYTCEELEIAIEYYIINKRCPTYQELREYIYNTLNFENNPEEYHEKDKIYISTENLHKLTPIIKDTYIEEYCSLCQEKIGINSFIKLPNCNHLFHSEKDKCLEDSNIITWLSKHKHCPNCNIEVVIK